MWRPGRPFSCVKERALSRDEYIHVLGLHICTISAGTYCKTKLVSWRPGAYYKFDILPPLMHPIVTALKFKIKETLTKIKCAHL